MSLRMKRLPKYYSTITKQIRFVLRHGLPKERSAIRIFLAEVARSISHREKSTRVLLLVLSVFVEL